MCSPVSLFLSFRPHADAQDTSEHTVLTRVLCVLYVLNPVPSPLGHPGHERAHCAHSCPVCPYLGFFGCPEHRRAHQCSPVSLFLSFRHHADAQDTSEHTVLTRVLCVPISVSLDAQNMGEHISARPCPLRL